MEQPMETSSDSKSIQLPENRFALELEFGKEGTHTLGLKLKTPGTFLTGVLPLLFSTVQSLASPAYLHFLATNTTSEGQSLLLCPRFKAFLRYLQSTWTRPDYSRFVTYPHAFHFLDLLINNESFARELAQVSFRNFCHQQQYLSWQNRFSTLYGRGTQEPEVAETTATS